MLIDSDVLIWFTRGHLEAKAQLERITPWRISTVTYLELAQGCRSKAELEKAKRGLDAASTEILPLAPDISSRAMELIDRHALADGLQVADALFAATALESGLPLLTANVRHFAVVEGLRVEQFEP